jgi:predicted DNA-binding transcriptional regulator AlpA
MSQQTARLVDANELAVLFGVAVRTIRRLDSAGKLPKPVKIGGAVRWRLDEITAWLAAECPDRQKWEILKHKAAI